MKLGLYHDITRIEEAETAAGRVAGLGFGAVQFCAGQPAGGGKPPQWIDLTDESCRTLRGCYERQGVEIVALSGYTNLTPRLEEDRLRNVEWLRGLIRRAPELGARYVVTWSGWRGNRLLDADPSIDTAQTWETFLESADAVVQTARETGVTIAWELYFTHVLGTLGRVRSALERWGGTDVGIVMDGPNLVPYERLDDLETLVDEQFAAFGGSIALAHAKDIRAEGGKIAYPGPGGGVLDYQRYVDRLRAAGYDGYVIIEHVTDETAAAAASFMQRFL